MPLISLVCLATSLKSNAGSMTARISLKRRPSLSSTNFFNCASAFFDSGNWAARNSITLSKISLTLSFWPPELNLTHCSKKTVNEPIALTCRSMIERKALCCFSLSLERTLRSLVVRMLWSRFGGKMDSMKTFSTMILPEQRLACLFDESPLPSILVL